jgi:hypothetical protein
MQRTHSWYLGFGRKHTETGRAASLTLFTRGGALQPLPPPR